MIAARDADLALRPGEVGVLLGRSGSGKSTLLTLLAGWQRPDAGRSRGRGSRWIRPGWRGPSSPTSRSASGSFPSSASARTSSTRRGSPVLWAICASGRRLLESLGLDELADRLPTETSIGQQQRTALARALVLQPPVLLADEPSSHQDASFRDRVWQQIGEAAAAGTACLIATHEDEAAGYATRLWRITDGKALQA